MDQIELRRSINAQSNDVAEEIGRIVDHRRTGLSDRERISPARVMSG